MISFASLACTEEEAGLNSRHNCQTQLSPRVKMLSYSDRNAVQGEVIRSTTVFPKEPVQAMLIQNWSRFPSTSYSKQRARFSFDVSNYTTGGLGWAYL